MSFRVLLMSLMATASLATPHHKFLRKDDVLDGVSGSFKREISSQEDAGMADMGSGTILNNDTSLMNHGMSPMQSNPETVGLEIDEGSAETPSSLSVDSVNNTASSSSLSAASDAPIKPPGNVESLSNGRHLRSILKEADKREVTTIKAPSCHCRSGRSYGETNQLMDLNTTAGPARSVPESTSAVASVSEHQDPVTEQISASPDPSIPLQGTGSMEDLTHLPDVSTGPTMQRTARCACAKIKRETNLDESSNTATNTTISGKSLGSLNATSGGNAHLSPAAGNDANVSAEIPLLSSNQVPATDSEVKLSNRTPQNAGRRQNNEHVQTRYARVVGSDGKPLDATSAGSSTANKTDESKSPVAKTANATTAHVNSTGVAQNASQVAAISEEISKNNATFVAVSSTNASTTNTTATTNEAANETDESRSPVAETANATIAHVNSTEIAQNATRVAARMKEISTTNATIVPISSSNISTTTATTNEAADKTDDSFRSSVLITANATVAHINSTGVAQHASQVAASSKEISKNNATTFVTANSTNASTTNTAATTNEADAYTEKYEDHYGMSIAPYRKFYPVTNVIMVTGKPTSSRGNGVSIKQMAEEYSSSHHLSASTFLAVGALLLSQLPLLPAYLST